MCRRTVRKGLALMVAGIVAVTLATFFPRQLAPLFLFSSLGRGDVTFYGFTLGAASGACGVLVATAGFLRSGEQERSVRLAPVIVLLLTAIAAFCLLSYFSFTGSMEPTSAPSESVTI